MRDPAAGNGSAQRVAVFLDRDGTLNEMVYDETHGILDSPSRVEDLRLCPWAGEFVREVRAAGYLTVVVTNQPGIAKGTLTPLRLDEIHARLFTLLAERGGVIDALRFCPHHPQGRPGAPRTPLVQECLCRKPAPGMLIDAAKELRIDLRRSWMVGDGLNDVQAGYAAGCRTILVGRLKLEHLNRFFSDDVLCPDYIAPDLGRALELIKSDNRASQDSPCAGRIKS